MNKSSSTIIAIIIFPCLLITKHANTMEIMSESRDFTTKWFAEQLLQERLADALKPAHTEKQSKELSTQVITIIKNFKKMHEQQPLPELCIYVDIDSLRFKKSQRIIKFIRYGYSLWLTRIGNLPYEKRCKSF